MQHPLITQLESSQTVKEQTLILPTTWNVLGFIHVLLWHTSVVLLLTHTHFSVRMFCMTTKVPLCSVEHHDTTIPPAKAQQYKSSIVPIGHNSLPKEKKMLLQSKAFPIYVDLPKHNTTCHKKRSFRNILVLVLFITQEPTNFATSPT